MIPSFCKGERLQTRKNKWVININGTHGDVSGVGASGSGNIIGKNIVISSGTISVNEQQLENIPDKYAKGLKTFSEMLNHQLKGQQVPEDKVKEVNDTLNDFAKEVQDLKPGEEKNIDPGQKPILNGKFRSIIWGVLKVIPTAARIGSI